MRDFRPSAGERNAIADIFDTLGYGRDFGNSAAASGLGGSLLERDEKLRMAAGDQASKLYASDSQYGGELARAQMAAEAAMQGQENQWRMAQADNETKQRVADTAGNWNLRSEQAKAQAMNQLGMLKAAMMAKAMGQNSMSQVPPNKVWESLGDARLQLVQELMKRKEFKGNPAAVARAVVEIQNGLPRVLTQSSKQPGLSAFGEE